MPPQDGLCIRLTVPPRHLHSAAWLMLSHPYLVPASYLASVTAHVWVTVDEPSEVQRDITVRNGDTGWNPHLPAGWPQLFPGGVVELRRCPTPQPPTVVLLVETLGCGLLWVAPWLMVHRPEPLLT